MSKSFRMVDKDGVWATVTKPVSVTGNGYVQQIIKRRQPWPFINETGILALTV